MAKFGPNSERLKRAAHPLLRQVLDEAIKLVDFSIICSYRGEEEQTRLFKEKKSKLQWPKSRHNCMPSLAVDVQPYFEEEPNLRWEEKYNYTYWLLAGVMFTCAARLGVKLRWGGTWTSLPSYTQATFFDGGHWEVIP